MPLPSANAIGQTVGRYGLGGFGSMVGGPLGGLLGRSIGGPLGGALFNLGSMGARGLGLFLNRLTSGFGGGGGGAPSNYGGVTASAGGWNIDKNGNLVSGTSAPAATQAPGLGHEAHVGGMSPFAMNNMTEVRKRNQL
jgi:hypothetical protein